MAQNVKIRDVVYQNVPSVEIPLSPGPGNAAFYDTSDATLYYEYISEVYEVDAGTSPYGFIRNCNVSLLNNGI